jgi:hypothetical protein
MPHLGKEAKPPEIQLDWQVNHFLTLINSCIGVERLFEQNFSPSCKNKLITFTLMVFLEHFFAP